MRPASFLAPTTENLTRRTAIAGLAGAPVALRAGRRVPNFLFILADDHAGYVMGCDGNTAAITPHIDTLASEGTRFSAHYCNSPVCTPSRQSFLTGQLPHAAGVTVLSTPLALDRPTLAKRFRASGYQTAVFGKMHFNRPGERGLHGFDLAATEDVITRDWRAAVKPKPLPAGLPVKPDQWRPFKDPGQHLAEFGEAPVRPV